MRRIVIGIIAIVCLAALTIGTARSSANVVHPSPCVRDGGWDDRMHRQDGAIDFLLDRIEGKDRGYGFTR